MLAFLMSLFLSALTVGAGSRSSSTASANRTPEQDDNGPMPTDHGHMDDDDDGHDQQTHGGNDTSDSNDGHGVSTGNGHGDDGHTGGLTDGHSDDDHSDGHTGGGHTGGHTDDGDSDDGHTGGHTGGGDTDSHDDGGHTDHGDHPTPPGIGASESEIEAYINALNEMGEVHVHDSGSDLAGEHTAAMDLAPREDATHVAIADGDWSDPAIWSGGEVPGDGAQVLIPPGVAVSYGTLSDASLFTVRVDGKLEFETDTDSKIVFDTMIVSPTGHLEIGTEDNPVDPSVDINLVIADNGAIDTDWDPMLLSRGLISHGKADIHGSVKDSHEKVTEDPMAGDKSVEFAEIPEGWQVGDTIVVAGTHYDGYKWDGAQTSHHESEDEERVITKIDGNKVFFEDALEFDHDTPRDDLHTSVANYTRNVSIESENGEDTDIFARGHVMFMHSDDVDVRYAEFFELGRTDKSFESFEVADIDDVEFDSNAQGRYSLHLHRTGVSDQDDPAIVEGNAVYGSPGWGFVHHDSNALLQNNASFDTFGAGYVAETGNETGAWIDNIAIYSKGVSWNAPKNEVNLGDNFDTARTGDGFWFQGRLVESSDNVAASVNHGFVYLHRDGDNRMLGVDPDHFAHPDALYNQRVTADDTPILDFNNNETFAANEGLHVVKANPNQGHDVWSHLDGFTAWSVKTGAHLEYTSHYVLTDFDVIGKDGTSFSYADTGINIGNNTSDIVIVDSTIADFNTGINLHKFFVDTRWTEDQHDYFVINPTFENVKQEFENFDPNLDTVNTNFDLDPVTPELTLDRLTYKEGYPDPEARVVEISGTKTDSLGDTNFPSGTDTYDLNIKNVVQHLEDDGYWTTSDGQEYFLLDIYTTDRLTGDVFYETHPVYLDSNVPLGNQFFSYADAKSNGVQDIVEMSDGTLMAGNTVLDTAVPAEPFAHLEESNSENLHMAHENIMQLLTNDQPVLSEHATDQMDADADMDHAMMH